MEKVIHICSYRNHFFHVLGYFVNKAEKFLEYGILSMYEDTMAKNMESKPKFRPNPKLRLMDQVREVLRYHHYAYRTEQTYCKWILRYIRFYGGKTHPKYLSSKDIERFLSYLATEKRVSASTQRQALNALVFLYRNVLFKPLEPEITPVRSKRKPRLPTVLSHDEVQRLFLHLTGIHGLMARLLYGSGLRLMECIRLRIKDIDFSRNRIHVVMGKGGRDRSTILPDNIREELKMQVSRVKALHHEDLEKGYGETYIPEALARKYPNACRETAWQYLFPSKNLSVDPRTGAYRRHHVNESGLQKAVKRAAARAGIDKRVTCHTLRHSFATHMLEHGINIRVLQELMGHQDVKTTEIYTHVMDRDISKLTSPLDF